MGRMFIPRETINGLVHLALTKVCDNRYRLSEIRDNQQSVQYFDNPKDAVSEYSRRHKLYMGEVKRGRNPQKQAIGIGRRTTIYVPKRSDSD